MLIPVAKSRMAATKPVYYITLIARNQQAPSATAIRIIPMGLVGGILSVVTSPAVSRFNTKCLLLVGTALCITAPLPCCFMSPVDINFWKHVFPTFVIGVAGVTITYCTVSIFILFSVPVNAESLCGGMEQRSRLGQVLGRCCRAPS
jgi:hypothetical protein